MVANVSPSRSISISVVRLILLLSANIPALRSHPLLGRGVETVFGHHDDDGVEGDPHAPRFWVYMSTACILVLLGGIFAGLTLGLMGQDEIYLQVIEQSGEEAEKNSAKKVLKLLKRGKHWVLVTLLLSNVITNETLPIVLDRSLGGGWPAVLASTVLIVIFGEIIPQSVCVRYGLAIGAYLSPFVLGLMYLMYPIAYPIAMLLDKILGEDHGTTYKKAGLKTLVTLHKTIGEHPTERLNQDEVTIISAVLDLKDKPVGSIMTPMADVFTMDSETVLDEEMMDRILGEGYSRIPIHSPGEPTNFVGMLLVKILITYDPEDAMKVKEFPLATLPETAPETSCLDIVNFFQEGKSHMVLVSKSPGDNYGAIGVLTLEDVIEELIGEEIIDESDVYIDVHKAIRRMNPSPIARRTMHAHVVPQDKVSDKATTAAANTVASNIANLPEDSKAEELLLDLNGDETNESRRRSTGDVPDNSKDPKPPSQMKRKLSDKIAFDQNLLSHLKHLGPSNRASAPRTTTNQNIKIKPGTTEDQVKKDSRDRSTQSTNRQQKEVRQVTFVDPNNPQPSQAAHTFPDHPPSQTDGVSDKDNYKPSKIVVTNDGERSREPSPTELFLNAKARSGSIVQRQHEVGGVQKVVIEATIPDSDEDSSSNSSDGKKKKTDDNSNLDDDAPNESTSLLGRKK